MNNFQTYLLMLVVGHRLFTVTFLHSIFLETEIFWKITICRLQKTKHWQNLFFNKIQQATTLDSWLSVQICDKIDKIRTVYSVVFFLQASQAIWRVLIFNVLTQTAIKSRANPAFWPDPGFSAKFCRVQGLQNVSAQNLKYRLEFALLITRLDE